MVTVRARGDGFGGSLDDPGRVDEADGGTTGGTGDAPVGPDSAGRVTRDRGTEPRSRQPSAGGFCCGLSPAAQSLKKAGLLANRKQMTISAASTDTIPIIQSRVISAPSD